MSKPQAQTSKTQQAINKTATVKFPKAKLREAMRTIGGKAGEVEAAQEAKQAAALSIVKLAGSFNAVNAEATTDAVLDGWATNWKALAMELAIEGNKFTELREAKGDKPQSAVMTGYGRNVVSIAKGMIEFDLVPDDFKSYREARKEVEALRAQANRDAHPEKAAFSDAVDVLDDTWSKLRDLTVGQDDIEIVEALTAQLAEVLAGATADHEAVEAIEAGLGNTEGLADEELAELQEMVANG